MANEAARVPALTAAVFYDIGRSLALWVSAYEILVHPGGTGIANFRAVGSMLDQVKWHRRKLKGATHTIGKRSEKTSLAIWVCRKIYDLRDDFLHGNDVQPAKLTLNGKPIIDFAACLYRLLLTAFLNIEVNPPITDDVDSDSHYFSSRMGVHRYQIRFEDALMNADRG